LGEIIVKIRLLDQRYGFAIPIVNLNKATMLMPTNTYRTTSILAIKEKSLMACGGGGGGGGA